MTDIFLMPDKWKIEVERDGDKARMIYEEWFYRKDIPKEQWDILIENTKTIVEGKSSVKVREWTNADDGMCVCIELEGDIKNIASGIVMEFLPLSKAGDISLSKIIECAIMGAIVIHESRDEAEKVVDRADESRDDIRKVVDRAREKFYESLGRSSMN